MGPYLEHYPFKTGSDKEDAVVRHQVQDLIKSTTSCPPTFDEKSMFNGPEAQVSGSARYCLSFFFDFFFFFIDSQARIQRPFPKCI